MAEVEIMIHRRTPCVRRMDQSVWIDVLLVEGQLTPKVTVFLKDAAQARAMGEALIAEADRADRVKAAEAAA